MFRVLQSDKKVYLAECENKYGFREDFKYEKAISYEQFDVLVGKWDNMLHACFLAALRSNNYMRIRNALLILNKIIKVDTPPPSPLPHYPLSPCRDT